MNIPRATFNQMNFLKYRLNMSQTQMINQMFSQTKTSQPLIKCYATKRRVRDYCVNGMSNDGRFRVALLDNTDSVNEACRRWNIVNPTHISLIGQVMSSAIVLSSFLKGEERIRVNWNNRSIHCSAEAIQLGEVRAQFEVLESEQTPLFTVDKILYNHAKPVMSSIQCSDQDNINDIMTRFFAQSEQIPTIVLLSTIPHHDSQQFSLFSYAVIIQELPSKDYDNEVREFENERTRNHLSNLQSAIAQFQKDVEVSSFDQNRAALHELLFSKFVVSNVQNDVIEPILNLEKQTVRFTGIDFLCRCSLDQVLSAFTSSISKDELQEIASGDETLTATCDYCNTTYHLEPKMFETDAQ